MRSFVNTYETVCEVKLGTAKLETNKLGIITFFFYFPFIGTTATYRYYINYCTLINHDAADRP